MKTSCSLNKMESAPYVDRRLKVIAWLCFTLVLAPYVETYSTGATTDSCVTLGVDHILEEAGTLIPPRTTPSWYSITVANADGFYTASRTLRVVIEAIPTTTFTGLILQARTRGTTTPVGRWIDVPANTRTLSCVINNDTVTHSNTRRSHTSLEFEWMPEQDYGQIEFRASVTANYYVFWTDLTSQILNYVLQSRVSVRSNVTTFLEDAERFQISICSSPPSPSDIEVGLQIIQLVGADNALSIPDIVIIPAWVECVQGNVTIEDDLVSEEDSSYLITASTVTAPNLIGIGAFITIQDNDIIVPSTVKLGSDALTFQEDVGNFLISVCAEPPPSTDIEVTLRTFSNGDDGLSVQSGVIIPVGVNCAQINVTVIDDLIPEENRIYQITIDSVTPPNLFDSIINITIEDNDDACSSLPCANDGLCLLLGDNFQCQCAYGYIGDICSEEEVFLPVSMAPREVNLTEGSTGTITVCYPGVLSTTNISISVSFHTASSEDINSDFPLNIFTVDVANDRPCVPLVLTAVEDNVVEVTEQLSLEVVSVSTNTSLRLDERAVSTDVSIMDRVILPCERSPCQNGGDCRNVGDDMFECLCTEEWRGLTCNSRIVIPCSSSPCRNGGVCSDVGEIDFECSCSDEFVGRDCSLPNPCLNDPGVCNNAGVCSLNGDGTVICECIEGFFGFRCETFQECLLNPCQNGGTCHSPISPGQPRQCECPPRYTGGSCELNNLCYGNPCKNGATCENLPNSFRCICPTGVTGSVCDIVIVNPSPCALNPCRNGGRCDSVDGMAVCTCPLGFDGPTCERRMSLEVDCPAEMSGYCQNGARCVVSVTDSSDVRCICPSRYTGRLCEITVTTTTVKPNNPCEPNPCENDGICFALSPESVTCTCTLDFLTGEFCNACIDNHCLNGGTCINMNGQPGCQCTGGWVGSVCERVVSEACIDFECNNGLCIIQNGRPACSCMDGFIGNRCDQADPCVGVLCLNGGVCQSGTCQCPVGFEGPLCEDEPDQLPRSLSAKYLAGHLCVFMALISNLLT